jgi:hypothetical protein
MLIFEFELSGFLIRLSSMRLSVPLFLFIVKWAAKKLSDQLEGLSIQFPAPHDKLVAVILVE